MTNGKSFQTRLFGAYFPLGNFSRSPSADSLPNPVCINYNITPTETIRSMLVWTRCVSQSRISINPCGPDGMFPQWTVCFVGKMLSYHPSAECSCTRGVSWLFYESRMETAGAGVTCPSVRARLKNPHLAAFLQGREYGVRGLPVFLTVDS